MSFETEYKHLCFICGEPALALADRCRLCFEIWSELNTYAWLEESKRSLQTFKDKVESK